MCFHSSFPLQRCDRRSRGEHFLKDLSCNVRLEVIADEGYSDLVMYYANLAEI